MQSNPEWLLKLCSSYHWVPAFLHILCILNALKWSFLSLVILTCFITTKTTLASSAWEFHINLQFVRFDRLSVFKQYSQKKKSPLWNCHLKKNNWLEHVRSKLLIVNHKLKITPCENSVFTWTNVELGLLLLSCMSLSAKFLLNCGVEMTDTMPVFYTEYYCSSSRRKRPSTTLFSMTEINIHCSALAFFHWRH